MPLKIVWRAGIAHAHGTVAGRRIRKSLETRDPVAAEQARASLEARAWQAHQFGAAAVVTFEDAALAYMEDGHDRRFIAKLLPHFRGRQVASITPLEIRQACPALYPTAKPATWNRQVIRPARAIINFAAMQGWCRSISVKQYREARPERAAADAAWIVTFHAEAHRRRLPYLAALARFLFESGCRISEAIRVAPGDVDFINRTMDLGRTKNGTYHAAHFSQGLMIELANLPARHGRVFGYRNRHSVYGPWQNICTAAEIVYLPPHQAGRHGFATALQSAGWDDVTAAKAGRWQSVRLFQETYTHPDAPGQRAAEFLGASIDGEAASVVDFRAAQKKSRNPG